MTFEIWTHKIYFSNKFLIICGVFRKLLVDTKGKLYKFSEILDMKYALSGLPGPTVPVTNLQYFTHKASVTSVHTEANGHSADWLMSVFCDRTSPVPSTQ